MTFDEAVRALRAEMFFALTGDDDKAEVVRLSQILCPDMTIDQCLAGWDYSVNIAKAERAQ